MNTFWGIIVSNALIATFLAVGVTLLGRVWKNAAAIHLLWLVVLFKLFTPPLIIAELPFVANWLPSTVFTNSAASKSSGRPLEAVEQPTRAALMKSRGIDHRHADANSKSQEQQDTITAATGPNRWSLSGILAAIWIGGASLIGLGYAISVRRFASLLRNVEPPTPAISLTVAQLANKLGLNRAPNVLMTSCALPPLVWSIGSRPRLILPIRLFARLSSESQAAILAHELTHIRRRDYLVRFVELFATTLFWWHPVVWWACSQLRDLEEQCCDSRALELIPHQARTYATALVTTLDFLSEQSRVLVPLPTAVHSTGSLSRRIRMLTQNRTNRLSFQSVVLIAVIVALPLVVAIAADASDPANNTAKPAIDAATAMAPAVLSGRVTNDAGEPLADARVRVAIPATDMRFVDSSTDHEKLETKTDAKGMYRLEIPKITKSTKISVDAMKPGYRKLVGTLMSGGDEKEVEVAPGTISDASLVLKPSLYLKGVVVDEQGKPISAVKVSAQAEYAHASGGVERTASSPNGSFEIFNYTVKPFADGKDVAKGTVGFFHPDYVGGDIDDVYTLPHDQRTALKMVLRTGRKISGTVLDVSGKPVPNMMIKATRENGSDRKATMTDADGKFALRGLVEGPATLHVHALKLKQKADLPITLDSDKNDLDVHLQSVSLPSEPKTVAVLGMQLTDATPDLKAAYNLYNDRGALIIDPGKDSDRLDIGKLVEGYKFWMVGDKRIENVRDFVKQILAEAETQTPGSYSVRVVYDLSTLDFDGTNTQYLKLTNDDLKQLRIVLDQLNEK